MSTLGEIWNPPSAERGAWELWPDRALQGGAAFPHRIKRSEDGSKWLFIDGFKGLQFVDNAPREVREVIDEVERRWHRGQATTMIDEEVGLAPVQVVADEDLVLALRESQALARRWRYSTWTAALAALVSILALLL